MSSSLPLMAQSASNSHSFQTKPLSLSPIKPSSPSTPQSPSRKHRPPSIHVTQKRSQLARRQSSISYIVSPPNTCPSAPLTCGVEWLSKGDHRHSGQLSRSMSLGGKGVLKGEIRRASARITSESDETDESQKRVPLTPVEKHAELLRVIAQKESICLELRSQLQAHEAELLQLKRKWEVVVSRGLDVPTPLSLDRIPATPNANDKGSAVVLEGIREGVQGVGRLILGQPVTTSVKSRPRGERHRNITTPNLSQSSDVSISSNASSWSSAMTASTKRTSVSSSGSAGADREAPLETQDTGTTPIMSPSPVFSPPSQQVEEPNAGKSSVQAISVAREESFSASASPRLSTKTLRRRSAGAGLSPLISSHLDDDWYSLSSNSPTKSQPVKPAKPSMNPSLPPPASIPGIGTFSGMDTNGLGKRWEDGLIKSQRRASTFLSDLVSAFSPPASSPSTHTHSTPSPSSATSTSASSPLVRTPMKLSPLSNSSTDSRSLLDDSDDDNTIGGLIGASVMIPEKSKTYPTKKVMPTPTASPLRRSSSQKVSKSPSILPDDEWNW